MQAGDNFQDKSYIMGIMNVTPDSFSGDGVMGFEATASAQTQFEAASLKQAADFLSQGADILDIGGESTRPGSTPIDEAEERRRVMPILKTIKSHFPDAVISIDTMKAAIADEAVALGASIINDVSAGLHDGEMLAVAAKTKVKIILMHNSIALDKIESDAKIGKTYHADDNHDIIGKVAHDLGLRIFDAMQAGIMRENIILDPGIGFGKSLQDTLKLINHLDRFKEFALPILLGASRKSFIGKLLDAGTDDRMIGSIIVAMMGMMRGANILRVHDVHETAMAVKILQAILSAK